MGIQLSRDRTKVLVDICASSALTSLTVGEHHVAVWLTSTIQTSCVPKTCRYTESPRLLLQTCYFSKEPEYLMNTELWLTALRGCPLSLFSR